MASWNITTSTPLPTLNRCAQVRPRINANEVVVTQHNRVIFQVRLSCPPACRLETPTTIEVKIRGIKIIFSRPIKRLLAIPIPYRPTSKNVLCGNKVSKNPNSTPNTAAIKICVFKLILHAFLILILRALCHASAGESSNFL